MQIAVCELVLLDQRQGQVLTDNMNSILTNAKICIVSEIFLVLVFWIILTQYKNQEETSVNLY